MVTRKLRKSDQEYAARTQLADYLRSVREVPVAANARGAAMCKRARERWEARNGRRTERTQVFCFFVNTLQFALLDTAPIARSRYFSG